MIYVNGLAEEVATERENNQTQLYDDDVFRFSEVICRSWIGLDDDSCDNDS